MDRQRFPQLDAFARAIADRPSALALAADRAQERSRVLSDLTTRERGPGVLQLRRFYWSAQRWRDPDGTFAAETFSYYKKAGPARWHTFPVDPDLTTVAGACDGLRGARVLQYIPLRRLTLRGADSAGEPIIVKIKRPDRWAAAADRLRIAHELLARSSFSTPVLRDVDPSNSAFSQSLCEGTPVDRLLTAATATALMARLGAVHAELNASAVGPQHDIRVVDAHRRAASAATWVAQLLPASAHHVDACVRGLASSLPSDDEPALCHGDMNCRQVLASRGRWAVVDFDLWHWGSRYRDVAGCLVSLRSASAAATPASASHTAWSGDEDAYLSGYEDRYGRPLEPRRLAWHVACAELEALAVMVRKDAYTPALFAQGLMRAERAMQRATAA